MDYASNEITEHLASIIDNEWHKNVDLMIQFNVLNK